MLIAVTGSIGAGWLDSSAHEAVRGGSGDRSGSHADTVDILRGGSSHLTFAASGRVSAHRNCRGAAAGIYEKLPAVGWLLRTIRKRMQAQ